MEEGTLGAGNLWVDRGITTLFKLKLKDWKEPDSHLNRAVHLKSIHLAISVDSLHFTHLDSSASLTICHLKICAFGLN